MSSWQRKMCIRDSDNPVGSGGVGGTDDRAQVVGVAELIAHHDQGLFPLLPGDGQDVVYGDVLPHRAQGNDALVGVGAVSYTHLDVYKRQVLKPP